MNDEGFAGAVARQRKGFNESAVYRVRQPPVDRIPVHSCGMFSVRRVVGTLWPIWNPRCLHRIIAPLHRDSLFSNLRRIRFQILLHLFPDFEGVMEGENGLNMQENRSCRADSGGNFGMFRKSTAKKAAENAAFLQNQGAKFAKSGQFMHAHEYASCVNRLVNGTRAVAERCTTEFDMHERCAAAVSRFCDGRVDVSRLSHRTRAHDLRGDAYPAQTKGQNRPLIQCGISCHPRAAGEVDCVGISGSRRDQLIFDSDLDNI